MKLTRAKPPVPASPHSNQPTYRVERYLAALINCLRSGYDPGDAKGKVEAGVKVRIKRTASLPDEPSQERWPPSDRAP